MGMDARQVQRWRQGTKPSGDALFALFLLAARVPRGVHLLLRANVSPPGECVPACSGRRRRPRRAVQSVVIPEGFPRRGEVDGHAAYRESEEGAGGDVKITEAKKMWIQGPCPEDFPKGLESFSARVGL